jgi:hypothetical protein
VAPVGLSGDGPSAVYRRLPVAAGDHQLEVRLRDSARTEGFDYHHQAQVTLGPREIMVVDFRAEMGGFLFRQDEPPGPERFR